MGYKKGVITMDLRIVKTRKAINDSFYELFEQKDFDKITVKDITEHAQIGRKTFYLHYIDKYDLLDRIVDKKFKALEEICEAKKNSVCSRVLKFGLRFLKKTKRFSQNFLVSNILINIRKICVLLWKKNSRKKFLMKKA